MFHYSLHAQLARDHGLILDTEGILRRQPSKVIQAEEIPTAAAIEHTICRLSSPAKVLVIDSHSSISGQACPGASLVKKFKSIADRRGMIEIRGPEVEGIARDLGYRSTYWPHGDSIHWLAAHLAKASHHPAMPNFKYRNGFPEPAQTSPDAVAASLNRLLPPNAK